MRRATYLLAATLLGACNAVFGLEPTHEGSEAGGGGGSGPAGGTGGVGGVGATGGVGGSGGSGGAGMGADGSGGVGGSNGSGGSGVAGASGKAGSGGLGGAGGSAGSGGAAGSAGSGGAGGQGSGGQGGGVQCLIPSVLEQVETCGKSGCKEQEVRCDNDNESCEIRCQGTQSCQGATLRCPPNKDCRVICDGDQACHTATMFCGAGNCELICTGDQESCQEMADVTCIFAQTCRVTCLGPKVTPPDVLGCKGRESSCPCESNCSIPP